VTLALVGPTDSETERRRRDRDGSRPSTVVTTTCGYAAGMRVGRSILASVLLTALAVAACSGGADPGTGASIPEGLDPQAVARGEALYLQYCASCHGVDLSGDADWKTPGPDGAYPPPPHDSSGHTWHHPDALLLEIIRDGSPFQPSNMPAFGSVLSDEDIMAILEYLKANWGADEREFQRSVTEQDPGG
jgi:mono/diheme cytochrome c family protein